MRRDWQLSLENRRNDFIRLALLCCGSHFGIFLVVIVSKARNFCLFPRSSRDSDLVFVYTVVFVFIFMCPSRCGAHFAHPWTGLSFLNWTTFKTTRDYRNWWSNWQVLEYFVVIYAFIQAIITQRQWYFRCIVYSLWRTVSEAPFFPNSWQKTWPWINCHTCNQGFISVKYMIYYTNLKT